MNGLRSVCVFAAITSLFGSAWAGYKDLKELKGLRIYDNRSASVSEAGRGDITRKFIFRFWNDTPKEVVSISVRLTIKVNGQVTYRSKPQTISVFENNCYPNKGTLLPGNFTTWCDPLAYTHANELW